MPLTSYLRLVAKQVNSVEATKKLVQMSHLFWHFSEDHILTAANKKFVDLKLTRNGYLNALRNETSSENFQNICNKIKRQNQKLSSSIAERHRAKYLRDNIKVYHN